MKLELIAISVISAKYLMKCLLEDNAFLYLFYFFN